MTCTRLWHQLNPYQFLYILDKLSSVISISTNKPVRFRQMFLEFLYDAKRCPEQFVVDRGKDNQKLALACFQLMKDGLKFNIWGLEASNVYNNDWRDQRTKHAFLRP